MSGNSYRSRCPHCQAELSFPAAAQGGRRGRRWRAALLIVGLLLLGCLLVGYRYRGQIMTVLDLANEATGSTTLSVLALTLIALTAACLAAWLLLPFLLAWAYLDLRHRFGQASACVCSTAPSTPSSGPPSQGSSPS